MSSIDDNDETIPKRKYYVTMTDKFMSGWGRAEGKTNKFVIGTDSYDQALILQQLALKRREMKYVNIASTKPKYPSSRYLVSYKNAEEIGWR